MSKHSLELTTTNWDKIVVCVSGGKDSAALMQMAVENFPKDKLVAVHSVIDIDWNETIGVVREQAKHFGLELVEVQAVHADGRPKGVLSQLTSPRVSRSTGEVGQYQFPDACNRWCTSMVKVAPIDKYVRSLTGNVLVLIGERAEESSQRAQLEAWRPDEKLSTRARKVVKYSAILEMKESEVWNVIEKNNIPKHPCYSWGVSRASCAICIFSSNAEIALAAKHAPNVVRDYINAEKQITHTFRYKKATKKAPEQKLTIADILRSEGVDVDLLMACEPEVA